MIPPFGGKVGSRQDRVFDLNQPRSDKYRNEAGFVLDFLLSSFYFILLYMVSWSTRHQFFYIAGTVTILLFAVALPTFFVVYDAPSCTDGKLNQEEIGTDCGGPCAVLCKADALGLVTKWQQSFKVKNGIYNSVAYVENPNLDSGIDEISYRFKLYDSQNILIYEKTGKTSIPPKKIFGIFEDNISTGSRIPAHTLFEFLGTPVWEKRLGSEPSLVISDKIIASQNGLPRLTALISNKSGSNVYNIEVVAIVYDASDNAVAVSKTIVDTIERGKSSKLIFTWPEPFSSPSTRVELTYRVLPKLQS